MSSDVCLCMSVCMDFLPCANISFDLNSSFDFVFESILVVFVAWMNVDGLMG